MPDPSGYLELSSLFVQVAVEFRGLQFLLVEVVPVYILEPWIVLEGHKGRPAQSTFWLIFVQKLVHELPCLLVLQRTGILEFQVQYFFVYLKRIFALFAKGHISTHKLEHIDAKGVKTNSEGVSFADDDLRSHIMRSSYQRISLCTHNIPALDYLSSNEIDQLYVSQEIHHEVLRLEIPHNDALGGEILKDEDHACNIKLGVFCRKNADFSDCVIQFFALNELDQRVKVMLIFEAFVVFHDEGMIQTAQQVLFLGDVLEQGVLFDLLFAVALQDVQFLFLHLVGAAYQQNRSKFSLFQFLQHDQLIQSIDQFVSSLDLLVKFLCLFLFVLFNHCIQEPTDDFLDNIHLYLRYHAIGLHDNIILISSLCFVLEQELLSVDLRPDCNRIDVFVFLQGSFNNDDDLLVVDVFCVFLYDYVAALVAVDLHQVQYLLYLFSRQFGEVAAFLYGPFHEVSEGDHKDLIAQHFAQSLSAKDKAGHIFLCFNSHLPHCIVKQSLLSKGISLLQFGHQLIALVHSCSAFFNDIERRSRISLIHNHLTLCVFLRDQCPSNGVLMIVGQTAEKPNILHKFFILLVLQNNYLLHCSPEGVPVDSPKMTVLAGFHRKRTRRFVQQRNFPEAIAYSKCLLDLIVGYDLHHAFLDDEEAHGLGLFREDEGLRIDRAVEHLLRYIFNFSLAEIIEDEMILQAAEQEGHLLIFLLLLLEVKLLIVVYLVDCLLALAILSQQMLTYSSQPDSLRSLQLSICCGIPWFLNIIKVIQFKQSMQKRVKRTLIGLAIGLVLITVLLVLLGLAKVDLDQNALNYNTITANYSDATLYGPGLHWIGISNRFLRFNKNQQTLRFSNLSAFSSDFYKITANMEVTLQFNFSSGGDQFKAGSKFFTLFGENPMEIINPLIKDRILIALSSQKSSFYQYTSLPNTVLQSSLATSISSALLQWVTTSINVIVQSVICEGSTSNTEIIDREIDSLIHDLQRTGVQQVELSNYFSSVYSNKQQQISSVSTALSVKALQLQRIYQMYGSNTTGFNISHIIYDNRPLKYNLNLVNILQELATIANRTFPY